MRLQNIQNCVAHFVSGASRFSHVTPTSMQCFHWNRQASNYAIFERWDKCLHGSLGGFQVPGLSGELVKFQTCLIFLRPLPTLVSDLTFNPLATGLSVNLTACRLHFLACWLIKQACLYQVSNLSQIWTSRLYVMTHQRCRKCYSLKLVIEFLRWGVILSSIK